MIASASIQTLLLEAALRTLMLGAAVLALVKLARIRDLRAESLLWTLVLGAGVAMPFLCVWAPGALVLRLPEIGSWAAAAPLAAGPALAPVAATHTEDLARALSRHAGKIIWALYCLIAAVGLARVATGLALTTRLYLRARKVRADWVLGRDIRVSAEIGGPVCFGRAILLPAGCERWPEAKRAAVLAHEESHVRRGDFFICLIAAAHRAVFWFSPFAWWLEARLGDLAETASDAAATRRINDPARYAEILLEVARGARPTPAMVAMAHGPGLAKRVTHILARVPEAPLGAAGRTLAVGAVLGLSFAFASVRAAAIAPPTAATAHFYQVAEAPPAEAAAVVASQPHRHAAAQRRARSAPALEPQPDFTYNPRALLDEPVAVIAPAAIIPLRGADSP
jgi:beta-lactamase regulating signal transducer with metallopeptidase domain